MQTVLYYLRESYNILLWQPSLYVYMHESNEVDGSVTLFFWVSINVSECYKQCLLWELTYSASYSDKVLFCVSFSILNEKRIATSHDLSSYHTTS